MPLTSRVKSARARVGCTIVFSACLAVASMFSASFVYAKTLKIASTPSGHLIWIAEEKGFFKDAGVDVEVVRFPSGLAASKALLAGEIDLATSSEFTFVSNVVRHPQLRILAGIARVSAVRLFTRADSGINLARDLVGRRVGVTRQSIGEYFLGEYLLANGIGLSEVDLVDMTAPDITDAIKGGVVDAAIVWQPFVHRTAMALGDNYRELPEQEAYFFHLLLIGQHSWVDANQRPLGQVLSALIQAEAYVRENSAEAQKMLADRLQLNIGAVQAIWDSYVREVNLDQTLLGLMEHEARWLVENGLADVELIPSFLSVIEMGSLRVVKPSAVRFIQ
tara:strand:- start:104 stop:1108 length:1005 start_codon:yes stop_codon:yes gene_type:complete